MFQEKLLRDALALYAGKHVLERVLRLGPAAFDLGGAKREMTVMWVEPYVVKAFRSSLASAQGARERIECWSKIIRAVEKHDGVIDNFSGDSVMVYFGSNDDVDHAASAIACARDIVASTPMPDHPVAVFFSLVGVDTGQVFLGNIGTPERIKYTIMGDAVNLASTLSLRTQDYRVQVLFSEAVVKSVKAAESPKTVRVGEVESGEGNRLVPVFTLA